MELDHARFLKLNASTQDAQGNRENKNSHGNWASRDAVPIQVQDHGDDFIFEGPDHQVAKYVAALQSIFEVKMIVGIEGILVEGTGHVV